MKTIAVTYEQTMLRTLTKTAFMRRFSTYHPNIDKKTAIRLSHYPLQKCNTILNFGRQGHQYVIERFGAYKRTAEPGIFFAFPWINRIYEIDTREMVVDVDRQNAFTRDNVSVSAAAQLFCTVTDPLKFCYGVSQPLVAVMSQAQSALRVAMGRVELDGLLKDRTSINEAVRSSLSNTSSWGVSVARFEITDLAVDKKIQEAMDLQSTAERQRRALVTEAEGKQRAMELEASGRRTAVELDATAKKLAVELEAQAIANAGAMLADVPEHILEYWLQNLHIKMVQDMATKGNHSTLFVPKDMSALPFLGEILNRK